MIPACPSRKCSFNRDNTEGRDSSKICVCEYMYVLVCVCAGIGFVYWFEKRIMSFEKCTDLFIMECDYPEVTLYGWQDIEIQ